MVKPIEGENILQDDYPVHIGYMYLVDEELISSPITGTVRNLKNEYSAKEVRNYKLFAERS